jgi:proline iminopeptidase
MKRMIFNRELIYWFFKEEARRFNLLSELPRIECPTLLLAGEDDPVCTIEDAQDIADRITPNLLRFERFANAGHGVFRDSPERALQIIRDFINN